MHYSTIVAALSAATLSQASFTSMSLRSASPVHLIPLVARYEGLWIGGETGSYCPEGTECPVGNVTAIAIAKGAGSMDVEVPGGQQLYVAPNGAVKYTIAHSANIPAGSYRTGFQRVPAAEDGGIATWTFTGGGATGLLACQVKDPSGKKFYKVFADVKGFNKKNCLGFTATRAPFDGPAAWQYT